MKVAELIEQLQGLNPELEVVSSLRLETGEISLIDDGNAVDIGIDLWCPPKPKPAKRKRKLKAPSDGISPESATQLRESDFPEHVRETCFEWYCPVCGHLGDNCNGRSASERKHLRDAYVILQRAADRIDPSHFREDDRGVLIPMTDDELDQADLAAAELLREMADELSNQEHPVSGGWPSRW